MTNFIDDAIGKMLAREKANPKLPILQRKKKAMMYRQKVVGNVVPKRRLESQNGFARSVVHTRFDQRHHVVVQLHQTFEAGERNRGHIRGEIELRVRDALLRSRLIESA